MKDGKNPDTAGKQGQPEDLKTRTKRFALRVIRLYSALPKATLGQTLGRQVLRSGTAVGANYHEAFRARSDAEFVAKLGDCLKELEETAYWLELIGDSELVASHQLAPLADETNQLIAILTAIVKKKKSSPRSS